MSLQVELDVSCELKVSLLVPISDSMRFYAILLNFLGDVRSMLVASTTRHYGFLSTKL